MSSSTTIETEALLSDFSARLLDTVDAGKKNNNKKIGDNKISGSQDAPSNFNLNSVLNNIRDNGSAYTDSKRSDARTTSNPKKVAHKSNTESYSNTKVTETRSDHFNKEIADDTFHLSSEKKTDVKFLNYISRTQLLSFVGFTAAIVGISMYMLDSHVDSSIQKSVENVNSVFPMATYDSEVKMDGEILRVPETILLSEMQPVDMNDMALISSSVGDLAMEVRSLKEELQQVKESINFKDVKETKLISGVQSSKLEVIEKASLPTLNESIAKVVSTGTVASIDTNASSHEEPLKESTIVVDNNADIKTAQKSSTDSLTVLLVSLSNKVKANEIINKLDMTGLSPQIKEVVVNGKQIYRISVSGFTSRTKATLFIQEAANKFGIKGSQVRKG